MERFMMRMAAPLVSKFLSGQLGEADFVHFNRLFHGHEANNFVWEIVVQLEDPTLIPYLKKLQPVEPEKLFFTGFFKTKPIPVTPDETLKLLADYFAVWRRFSANLKPPFLLLHLFKVYKAKKWWCENYLKNFLFPLKADCISRLLGDRNTFSSHEYEPLLLAHWRQGCASNFLKIIPPAACYLSLYHLMLENVSNGMQEHEVIPILFEAFPVERLLTKETILHCFLLCIKLYTKYIQPIITRDINTKYLSSERALPEVLRGCIDALDAKTFSCFFDPNANEMNESLYYDLLQQTLEKQANNCLSVILEQKRTNVIKENLAMLLIPIKSKDIVSLEQLLKHKTFTVTKASELGKKLFLESRNLAVSGRGDQSIKSKIESLLTKYMDKKPKKQSNIAPKKQANQAKKSKNRQRSRKRPQTIMVPVLETRPTSERNIKELIEKEAEKVTIPPSKILKQEISDLLSQHDLPNIQTTLNLTPDLFKQARKEPDTKSGENVILAPMQPPRGQNNVPQEENNQNEEAQNELEVQHQPDNEEEENKNLFEGKAWDLTITNFAMKQWKKLDTSFRESVQQALVKLAENGPSRNRKAITLAEPAPNLHLFESKATGGIRIIWELAIDHSPTKSDENYIIYSDIIRIWCITKHDGINSSVQRIIESYRKGKTGNIKNNLVPFGTSTSDQPRCYVKKGELENIADTNAEEEFSIFPPAAFEGDNFAIEKFYDVTSSLSKHIIDTKIPINDSTPEEQFFRISEQEFEVISSGSRCSTILLGRSGTGKTTCALTKMWATYYAYWSKREVSEPMEEGKSPGNFSHLHQVFVTANSLLRTEVETTFLRMKSANIHGHKRTALVKENSLDSNLPLHFLEDIPIYEFPLFLTSRQWVIMIDGTLRKPFFSRTEPNKNLVFPELLYAPTQEMKVNNYSLETLSLANDDFIDHDDDIEVENVEQQQTCQEIDYHYFYYTIWPIIRPKTSKEEKLYPCALVWKEIFSYIKGSLQVLQSTNRSKGFLTREEYLEVGAKLAPNFNGNRSKVYDIFENYQNFVEKKKYSVKLFDWADVIHHCINQLLEHPYEGIPIHHLTYDEVQDASQIELYLFFLVVRDVNQFFFTGDTCQTIARGIGFRFKDLRSIFHLHQVDQMKTRENSNYHSTGNEKVTVVPQIKFLLRNFRSHRGITSLASGVIELLKFFFPESYDDMDADQGVYDGPIPLVILSDQVKDLYPLLFGNSRGGEQLFEFGANQVIIVRDQEAKKNLPSQLRQGALCMTVFECKGLEFNDVLLYNFFSDSPFPAEWKFIRNYKDEYKNNGKHNSKNISSYNDLTTKEEEEKLHELLRRQSLLKMESNQYKSLCEELKYLYVAITRARANIWFYDSAKSQTMEPLVDFFSRRELVEILRSERIEEDLQKLYNATDTSNLSRKAGFAQQTTPHEWDQLAQNLFDKKLWEASAYCFNRSGNKKKYHFAHGKQLQAESLQIVLDSSQKRKLASQKFIEAAREFLLIREYDQAGISLHRAKEVELAQKCFRFTENWVVLARMAYESKNYTKASEYLLLSGQLSGAMKLLSKKSEYKKLGEFLSKIKLANPMVTWDDIFDEYIPSSIIKEKIFLSCYHQIELASELVSRIHPDRLRRIFRVEHKKFIKHVDGFIAVFKSMPGVFQVEVRNLYYQSSLFQSALSTAQALGIDALYKTVRGLFEANKSFIAQTSNRAIVEPFFNSLMNQFQCKQNGGDPTHHAELLISYSRWLRPQREIQSGLSEDESRLLKMLIKEERNVVYLLQPLSIVRYYQERFSLNETDKEKPSRRTIKNLALAFDKLADALCVLVKAKISDRIHESTEQLVLLQIFEFWGVRRNTIGQGFSVTLLSPLANDLQMHETGQFEVTNKKTSEVYHIIICETIGAMNWLKQFFIDHYPFQSSRTIRTFDYSHYELLYYYWRINQAHDTFTGFIKQTESLSHLPHDKFMEFLPKFSFQYELRDVAKVSLYPPPQSSYWVYRNEFRHLIAEQLVPSLWETELQYRAKMQRKFIATKEKPFWKVPFSSIYNEYIYAQSSPNMRYEILKIRSEGPPEDYPRDMSPLIRSERAWQQYQVKYSIICSRNFLVSAIGTRFPHEEFLNIFEVSVLRFLTVQRNPMNKYLYVAASSYQRMFRLSEDEMIIPDVFADYSEFVDTESKTFAAILDVLVEYVPSVNQLILGDPTAQPIVDRLGLLIAVLLLNLKDKAPNLFENLKKVRLPLQIFTPAVSAILRRLLSYNFDGNVAIRELNSAIKLIHEMGLVRIHFVEFNGYKRWDYAPYLDSEEFSDNLDRMKKEQKARTVIAQCVKTTIQFRREKRKENKVFALIDPSCPSCYNDFSEDVHDECNIETKQVIRLIYHQKTLKLLERVDNIKLATALDIQDILFPIEEFIAEKYEKSVSLSDVDVEDFLVLHDQVNNEISASNIGQPILTAGEDEEKLDQDFQIDIESAGVADLDVLPKNSRTKKIRNSHKRKR